MLRPSVRLPSHRRPPRARAASCRCRSSEVPSRPARALVGPRLGRVVGAHLPETSHDRARGTCRKQEARNPVHPSHRHDLAILQRTLPRGQPQRDTQVSCHREVDARAAWPREPQDAGIVCRHRTVAPDRGARYRSVTRDGRERRGARDGSSEPRTPVQSRPAHRGNGRRETVDRRDAAATRGAGPQTGALGCAGFGAPPPACASARFFTPSVNRHSSCLRRPVRALCSLVPTSCPVRRRACR